MSLSAIILVNRGPTGPAGPGGGGPTTFQMTNKSGMTATIGQPVYVSGPDQFSLAKADSSTTKSVIGLIADASVAADSTGTIMSNGFVLEASAGEWDTVTGGTAGLSTGASYFLSADSAGTIAQTAPTDGWVAKIGIAISATKMLIQLETTVLL